VNSAATAGSAPFYGTYFVSRDRAEGPRAVTHPGLPRIRTCAINAYGSSSDGLAYGVLVQRVCGERMFSGFRGG